MKKIVGIISNVQGFNNDDIFKSRYYTLNTYVKAIKEAGGIPIIIPPVDLKLNEEACALCDAYLIPGGIQIKDFHIKIVDYAIKHKKKLLGICMGMQTIGIYANQNIEDKVLIAVNNHYVDENITTTNPEVLVHNIDIVPNSLLANIFGKTKIKVNSLHHYAVKGVKPPFKVSAICGDVIEAIEYNNVLGVQFHPELIKKGKKIFKWLTS